MHVARMGPASSGELAALKVALKAARTKSEHRRVEAVWLARRHRMKPSDVGEAVGFDRSHVYALLASYRQHGVSALAPKPQGGRHRENMSVEEEAAVLEPLKAKAGKGGVLVVAEVQAAYEKALGRRVPPATVYFMLHRHGWRKLQPRPRHREADPSAQEDFKKTSPRSSKPPSKNRQRTAGPSG